MRNITLLLIFCSIIQNSYSQGTSVTTAEPFCSGGSELVFPNISGQPDATDVGCLGSIPNAAYYYLTVDQPGDLIFTISQEDTGGNPIDVDFIAWGPFASIAAADAAITLTDCPTCPNNTTNPTFYPYAPDNIVDCSYDIAPTESLTIPGATSGEIYVVLITNFNGSAGTISLQQTSGTGTTSCNGIPTCGGNYTDSGGDTGSYSNNENNTTTIYPSVTGGIVTVNFTSFNVAAGDVLTVYNGPTDASPSLGTVTSAPASFTSTDASGALTFVFTSNASGVAAGWESDVTCTIPPTCGSSFYDSGGLSGNYSNNENQISTFYPDTPGDALTINFTAFDLENNFDYLYVYNGPNVTSPILDILTGNAVAPISFTSTDPSGALTFRFTSDFSNVNSGWESNITCAPYVPPVVCGSTFYDSGGVASNYFNNENTTTTLVPDNANGYPVTVTFTSFDLESCCDSLTVYDGPDATSPSLGTYTGTGIPGPFTSSHASGALTFVFTSDISITGSGWSADITCVDPCNLIITDTIYPLGADSCNLDYTELTTNAPIPGPTNTVFLEEFNSVNMPAGWTIVNETTNTEWVIATTNNAGGIANEAVLEWSSGFDIGTWSLTSPLIDITGATGLMLEYKQELDHWSSFYPYSLFVETSTDNTVWTVQNSTINPTNDIAASTVNIDISALDGNTSLYIRFRFTGEAFGIFSWSIDDVLVTSIGAGGTPEITWTPITGLYTDATLTTPYVAGDFAGTVYAAPNGFMTYQAEDQNNCTDTADVQHDKKIWNGSDPADGTNWYVADNWTPVGVPTNTNCVVIPDPASSNGNSPIADIINLIPLPPQPALARNLTVQANGFLEIESDTSIEVVDWINVNANGTLLLRDSSSLIQITEGAANTNNNTGNINMQRSVSNLNAIDYVYWSSPVENFNVELISPNTALGLIWKWLPTQTAGGGIGNHGDWRNPAANEQMPVGAGYIVRDLGGATLIPNTPALPTNTTEFVGRPNNGVLTYPISRGTHLITDGDYTGDNGVVNGTTHQDDNWNLVGNPFPSAISYVQFMNANSTIIDGTIYLWTHQNAPSAIASPFYENFIYNYSDDYIDNNYTGSNPPGFNGNIASGQAFFVQMLDTGGTTENLTFNNSMRSSTNDNSQFYRNSSSNSNTIERHRIWLDLITANDQATSTLVGYVEGATNQKDQLFDGYDFEGYYTSFYSIIDNEKMAIQGRALPFVDTDTVPMGIIVSQAGNYSIAINTLDGLFESTGQDIYIEDTYNNIIHDLRLTPYSFTTESGTFNDRFILRYTNDTLSLNQNEIEKEITIIAPNGNYIKVNSTRHIIDSVTIYDVIGRTLFDKENINSNEVIIEDNNLSNGTYIVKATTSNGSSKTQKVVLNH
ncbi:CUB domain-containing protein [uncultured Psychroserpens sp.]|uniref:CUB domain-containing protein n=1 Tax=uncultured Psychroserpens sp. TaxID=255436 RepID=UPI00260A4D9D|nr:CUB domain-containing protein [uncultured Psychroserpens sp.]